MAGRVFWTVIFMSFKWNLPLPNFWNRTCETGLPCLLAELQSLIRAEGVSLRVCGWLCGGAGAASWHHEKGGRHKSPKERC